MLPQLGKKRPVAARPCFKNLCLSFLYITQYNIQSKLMLCLDLQDELPKYSGEKLVGTLLYLLHTTILSFLT